MENAEHASREKLIQAKIPGAETGIEIKKSICSVCNVQCGIDAYVRDGRLIKVEGTGENPTNRGVLCVKGTANRQWVYNRERLQTPLIRTGEKGSGQFAPISWDKALDTIAARLNDIKRLSSSPVSPSGLGLSLKGSPIPSVPRTTPRNRAPAFLRRSWPTA
jgi:anaerobic selenocysteine-containing dehydrogenase